MKLSNEARIGIVVFIAGLIFFGGVMYLRGVEFQRKEYSLVILYNNVNGLREGSPITVAGYAVGKVQSMTLSGSEIAVEVSIKNSVHVSNTSKAEIKSASIMGGKFIAVTPGNDGRVLADGDTLRGTYQADLTELTSTLAPISSNVLGILENVNSTFDEKTRHGLQRIVQDVSHASTQIDTMVRVQGQKLNVVLDNFAIVSKNLAHFSSGLDTMARTQRATLDSSLNTIRAMAKNLHTASQQIQVTTQSIDSLVARVDNGHGTLGKFVKDEALYRHVDSVAINLNDILQDMKERPGQYIKFSIF